MKIKDVIQFFESNGYKEIIFTRKNFFQEEAREYTILPFDIIYASQNKTEIYIIVEKTEGVYTKTEIEEMESKVAAFIPFLKNTDPIKYNINLLLLCPLQIKKQKDIHKSEIASILGFERSKYTCRKLFLDTANNNFEDELTVIPSFPLHVHLKFSENEEFDLIRKVKETISDDLYKELKKEKAEININRVTLLLKDEDND